MEALEFGAEPSPESRLNDSTSPSDPTTSPDSQSHRLPPYQNDLLGDAAMRRDCGTAVRRTTEKACRGAPLTPCRGTE